MTIVDAWKAAKVGQQIRNGIGATLTKRATDEHNTHSLVDVLTRDDASPGTRMFDFHVLATDWEIVKTPCKYEATMGELRKCSGCNVMTHIPNAAKVLIEWEA